MKLINMILAVMYLSIMVQVAAAEEPNSPASAGGAEDVAEPGPVIVLFSSAKKETPHGLWMNGINRAEFKQIEQNGHFVMILKGRQGVVGFNGHTPLKSTELPENGLIRIRFRSDRSGTDNKIIFSWRLDNQKRSTAASQKFKESEQWQTILLPLPAIIAETGAKGYWITFEEDGNYEISDIDVIEKKQGN